MGGDRGGRMPVMQVVQRLMGEAMQATLQWQCARILCGVMEGVGACVREEWGGGRLCFSFSLFL